MSLSLNVPGFPKSNSTVKTFFHNCLLDLKYTFTAHRIDLHLQDAVQIVDAAGDFYLVPFSMNHFSLNEIKQICEEFEETHPLGRFVDVDLNDEHGNTVSSGKIKLCFFCQEKPAIECRRENTHHPEKVRSFMFSKMESYHLERKETQMIRKLSSLAQQAILSEISLSPKPGLVDKFSNGSHRDMNYQTFMVSTAAISPFFEVLVREGFAFKKENLTQALPIIRNIGLQMETAMFKATQKINTQKGIIFLMGLSLFACGKLFSQFEHFLENEFRAIIKGICTNMVGNELCSISAAEKSHGEKIFLKYRFSGARGEAESGFQTVFENGLPELNKTRGLSDEALIKCFLAIAANNDDTNILYRSNPQVLESFKRLCSEALENFSTEKYQKVIEYCKNESISPGGSADLLAVTIFVWLVTRV